MSRPDFWAEAQRRTDAVLSQVRRLLRAVRDHNYIAARHIFICMRTPAENLRELFGTGGVLFGSSDLDTAFLGYASFANSLNGYAVVEFVFAKAPHRLQEFVEVWCDSLENMLALCKRKQHEVAESN